MSVYKPVDMLLKARAKRKSVLIVEPNAYHGELLPGYTRLMQELGFEVDVLMRSEVAQEDPFCRVPKGRLPRLWKYELADLENVLASMAVKKYQFLFFSTNVLWERDLNESSLISYLGFEPVARTRSLFVEHNMSYLEKDNALEMLKQGRLFTLLKYSYNSETTRIANPHYFGNISFQKNFSGPIRIALLGSPSRDPVNLKALFESVRLVSKKTSKPFKIIVVGGGIKIPDDIEKYFDVTGRINFPEYYDLIEQSHFILTLIDLRSDDIIHTKYRSGTTTGSLQTSLGFRTPMIIDSLHADSFRFSDASAVIFGPNQLADGLSRSLELTPGEYASLQANLKVLADEIEQESLQDLKVAIEADAQEGRHSFLASLGRIFRP